MTIDDVDWQKSMVKLSKLLTSAAGALDFAHEHGIIHRDVKPSNMMIDPRTGLVLTDFGIAAQLNDPGATITGMLVGTPAYLTPEQIRGQQVSAQTDIYQLGATAYELLTGSQPFADRPSQELLIAHLEDTPIPVQEVGSDLNPTVNEAVVTAMAKLPGDRYQTATEFITQLAESLQITEIIDVPPPIQIDIVDPETTIVEPELDTDDTMQVGNAIIYAKKRRRWPLWLAAAAVVLMIPVITFGMVVLKDDGDRNLAAAGTTSTSTTVSETSQEHHT